ncbi:MAG TPA: nucleoside deaminase [Synergistaceae bacterium]|nr:nucleoside deaminase [Synergistaceae bacterium]HPJ26093.1 nucleoside deaminase [Synergistaceae bacterium]HPQ36020.1 nucleoside deaminase [Synergistaceae bacterium]
MNAGNVKLAARLLSVMEEDICPLTEREVPKGNKVFGAAILLKEDWSLVVAGTNREGANPLWHGEIATMNDFYALPSHPRPEECLFLSTHQPCSMCYSALAWAGFPQVYYLFGFEETRDLFSIPHDIRIQQELFGCTVPNKKNAFLELICLREMIPPEREDLTGRIIRLEKRYARLAEAYEQIRESCGEITRK